MHWLILPSIIEKKIVDSTADLHKNKYNLQNVKIRGFPNDGCLCVYRTSEWIIDLFALCEYKQII